MNKRDFPHDFMNQMEATDGIELTSDVIHHAAAGMTLLVWRNTSTVEDDAHAEGDWSDPDMLRMNTRATQVLREAITQLWVNSEDGGETLLDAMREICDLLPTEAMKDNLWDESHHKADFWGSAIEAFGPERVLTVFTQGPPGMLVTCNTDWWGHPNYPARVAVLAAMNPPEPETFIDRALNEPWECPTSRRGSSLTTATTDPWRPDGRLPSGPIAREQNVRFTTAVAAECTGWQSRAG